MSLIINIEFKRVFIISLLTFLILFGILSNIINIYVFSHRSMRNVSVFRFLLYLSLVDLLVVLICIGDLYLVYGFSIEIKLYSSVACRLITFLTNYLAELSSLLLMFISIERVYVILNKSFKSFLLKTKRFNIDIKKPVFINQYPTRIEKLTIFLLISLFLMNLHYLMFLNLNESTELNDLYYKNNSFSSLINKTSFQMKNLEKILDMINVKNSIDRIESNDQNEYL